MDAWLIENILWVGVGTVVVIVGAKVLAFRVLARLTHDDTQDRDGG